MSVKLRSAQSLKELKQQIRSIGTVEGVRSIGFSKSLEDKTNLMGSYDCESNEIVLQVYEDDFKMMNVAFMHELAHHVAVQAGAWRDFHLSDCRHLSANYIFLVESAIDRVAKSLWNKYVSRKAWGNYIFVYSSRDKASHLKFLEDYYKVTKIESDEDALARYWTFA